MKHIKPFQNFINEAKVANKWEIESHHIGGLQKGKMTKYTDGATMPFDLISNSNNIADTDKKLVADYVDADHLVLSFHPMEDLNNDTLYDAVKSDGVKVMQKLLADKYNLKLVKTLKGKLHCSNDGELCSVLHYLVFKK